MKITTFYGWITLIFTIFTNIVSIFTGQGTITTAFLSAICIGIAGILFGMGEQGGTD